MNNHPMHPLKTEAIIRYYELISLFSDESRRHVRCLLFAERSDVILNFGAAK